MRRKTIRSYVEWVIAVLLIFLFFNGGHLVIGNFSADKAHELSESSYHYGPSEISRKIHYNKDIVIYLGTYKKWFSADTVNKRGLGWFPDGGVSGREIDTNKPLTYSWEIKHYNKKLRLAKFFGYVTDERISSVVLNVIARDNTQDDIRVNQQSNVILKETLTEDRLFIFLWNEIEQSYAWQSIQGLDGEGKVIYEEKLN
ncbi:hypothetical protein [Cohnella sp. WQ 127256]|uniref:hypothetical protein n=1 Tax=Cohnella sp. WQ 127256 TaxID=2938790 RepID=UPI002117E64E|nr:hypothetical protein [Cohnella sp. WQ 127256]